MGKFGNLREQLIKLNRLLADFTRSRQFYSALNLIHHIHSSHLLRPDHYTLSTAITACANLQETFLGAQLHAFGLRAGLGNFSHVSNSLLSLYAKSQDLCGVRKVFGEIKTPDVYSWTTLLSACAKLGDSECALQVFDEMPQRDDAAVWNAIITGCAENGDGEIALGLFRKMHMLGVRHDNYTFATVLSLCFFELLGFGVQVHSVVVKTGFLARTSVVNALLTMYFNCKCISDAFRVFKDAEDGVVDQITYNAMIAGLVSMERNEEALVMFKRMRLMYLMPTGLTFVSLMSSCSDETVATQVHALVVKHGFEDCTSVSNAAMTMYSYSRDLKATRLIFERMKERDVVSWNAMITSYMQENLYKEAIVAYIEMKRKSVPPDEFTLGSLLSSSESLADAESILSIAFKNGLILKIEVSNSLISALCKLGEMELAYRFFFHEMPTRNLISWNAIISGCQSNGLPLQGLELFTELLAEGLLMPNAYTLSTALSICASIPSLQLGKQIHTYILKFGLLSETSVGNALIAHYSKCGILQWSVRVFKNMTNKDVVSWNSMISAYAQHGEGQEAVHCFETMLNSGGVEPDSATFLGVLSACSHAGLVEDGIRTLNSMVNDYGIRPETEHFSCIVDILSRAGYLDEAEKLLAKSKNVEVDSAVWWALFGSCAAHGDTRLGRIVAGMLLETEKDNPSTYVLLSNIYAGAGRFEESARVRELMQRCGVMKKAGSSWVRS